MKTFFDYKDELYTCSRCGLCQSVCPIFEITQKETTVSRGFFSLLNGVIKGHLKFNKKIRKNIDKCLTCNKCKDFCPSGIDAEKIITSAKIESFSYAPLWKKLALQGFYSKTFLRLSSLVKLYRFFPVLNFTKIGKILDEFLTPNIVYKKQNCSKKSNLKIIIFAGCINNHFNSSSLDAMKMLLEKNGITAAIPDFDCCTMPAYNIGDIDNFKKFAVKNLDKIPSDTDYILFDCASCKKAFRFYGEVLEGKYQQKAQEVFKKCKHINEFLLENNLEITNSCAKAIYHKPCHLDCHKKSLELMDKIGLDIVPSSQNCCGSAGLFFIENFDISQKLATKRIQELTFDNPEMILTDCPLCRLGLIKGAVLNNFSPKILNLAEFLAQKL